MKETTKAWRKRLKTYLIKKFGGKCQICGYSKCSDAFEFHHLDSSSKKFSIGNSNPKHMSWDEVVEEAEKCIMVCANCHREIHFGLVNPNSETKKQ